MKVVVDIPNWLYNAMMEHRESHYSQSLGDAVRDGTPLPKGHGCLIDQDALIGKIHGVRSITAVLDAPVIIQADGGAE